MLSVGGVAFASLLLTTTTRINGRFLDDVGQAPYCFAETATHCRARSRASGIARSVEFSSAVSARCVRGRRAPTDLSGTESAHPICGIVPGRGAVSSCLCGPRTWRRQQRAWRGGLSNAIFFQTVPGSARGQNTSLLMRGAAPGPPRPLRLPSDADLAGGLAVVGEYTPPGRKNAGPLGPTSRLRGTEGSRASTPEETRNPGYLLTNNGQNTLSCERLPARPSSTRGLVWHHTVRRARRVV